MKIAAYSDLHAHIFKDFDKVSNISGSTRLDNIINTLKTIRQYCVENNIQYIMFGGDLFNTRGKIDIKVYNAVYDEIKAFSESKITSIMIAGNHDEYSNSDIPDNALHSFKVLSNTFIFDTYGEYNIPDTSIVINCVPYSRNIKGIIEYINSIASNEKTHILLMHAGITGGVTGKNNYPLFDAFTLDDLRPNFFKYVVLGHFHKRQFLGGYHHNTFYCGSPIQHSFNDEGEDKGFYVVDTSKICDIQFVPIPNPKFVTVNNETTEEELKQLSDNGDYIRAELKETEVQDFINKVPSNMQYKIILQKEYKGEVRVDVKVGMPFHEIVSKYADKFKPEAKPVGLKILEEVMKDR